MQAISTDPAPPHAYDKNTVSTRFPEQPSGSLLLTESPPVRGLAGIPFTPCVNNPHITLKKHGFVNDGLLRDAFLPGRSSELL